MLKNNIITRLLPVAAITAMFCLSSCWFLDPTSELYRIHIDSISVPSAVVYNSDSVVIKFWGKIGSDTCHSFSHFQGVLDTIGIELAVWGFYNPAYRKGCPSSDVQLAGREFRAWPLRQGIFTVTIRQPDGTVFKKFVDVN